MLRCIKDQREVHKGSSVDMKLLMRLHHEQYSWRIKVDKGTKLMKFKRHVLSGKKIKNETDVLHVIHTKSYCEITVN